MSKSPEDQISELLDKAAPEDEFSEVMDELFEGDYTNPRNIDKVRLCKKTWNSLVEEIRNRLGKKMKAGDVNTHVVMWDHIENTLDKLETDYE